MKWITTILVVILLTCSSTASDWSFTVHPDSLRLISAGGMEKPRWYMNQYGVTNLVNLSFFTGRGFIPPYKDSSVTVLRNPHKWPYFCIGDACVAGVSYVGRPTQIPCNGARFIVSGYPILIQDSTPERIKRSFFTRRVCPRTAIGVRSDGYIVIFVTTAANLKTLQRKMLELGCVDALNLDGGSSTFLYVDGVPQLSSKQARQYPNILTW